MKPHAAILALSLVLAACASTPAPKSAAHDDPAARDAALNALRDAWSAALQADARTAVARLKPIAPALLEAKNADIRACMLERLDRRSVKRTPPLDPALYAVLAAYREYWLRSLRAEHPAAANEADLLKRLNAVLVHEGQPAAADLDAIEAPLQQLVQARGWHSLHGVTSPLREFMVWKTQEPAHYDVALPAGTQPVTVVFMDGFASLGWAAFATCDRAHTGGWTKPDALYAVRSGYDVGSENFRVSYLAHEAQHYADNAAFPALEQPELEYRAKLTEFALARETQSSLLDGFASNTSTDRAIPHSWANARVIADLETATRTTDLAGLHALPPDAIRDAAATLLREDTARRKAP